jgi:isoleucyl-tRNA synthetase
MRPVLTYIRQGIAVNPEMIYAILRQETTGRIIVVAKDLVPDLSEVIGTVTPIADVPGTDLVGLEYHPIFSSITPGSTPAAPLRVFAASYVTASSGTGLVHTAPAHGAEDYATFRNLGLLSKEKGMICHVDDDGCFDTGVKDVLGDKGDQLIGKEVLDTGSRTIIGLLKEADALLKIKRIKHKYPYDWKTKKPVIMR